MHASRFSSKVRAILAETPTVQSVEIPELGAWLCDEESRAFAYEKSWEEANSDPWLILHTSGTTGQTSFPRASSRYRMLIVVSRLTATHCVYELDDDNVRCCRAHARCGSRDDE